MKTATLRSLRVDPALRGSAENVLRKGESLSCLMEQSLRNEANCRRTQAEFIARWIAARDKARQTREYFEANGVHAELRTMLDKTKA